MKFILFLFLLVSSLRGMEVLEESPSKKRQPQNQKEVFPPLPNHVFQDTLSFLKNDLVSLARLSKTSMGINRIIGEFSVSILGEEIKFKDLKEDKLSVIFRKNGVINSEDISDLTLCGRKIKTVPIYLSLYENIKTLNLSFNKIEQIPPQVKRLRKLKILNLTHNPLKKVAPELAELSLDSLKLYETGIKVISQVNEGHDAIVYDTGKIIDYWYWGKERVYRINPTIQKLFENNKDFKLFINIKDEHHILRSPEFCFEIYQTLSSNEEYLIVDWKRKNAVWHFQYTLGTFYLFFLSIGIYAYIYL